MRHGSIRFALFGFVLALAAPAAAGEIGHFNPGIAMIRDYQLPDPGFYFLSYQYFYSTDRLNDEDGKKIDSVFINPGPGPGVTLDVDVDVELFAWVPALIWVSKWKPLGAKYGAFALPAFASASISAGLNRAGGAARDIQEDQFAIADWYVSPLWLTWSGKHYDASFAYGFYAPTGRYDVQRLDLPVVGRVKVEEPDNIGYGFWTNQFQAGGTYYPFENRATAIAATGTYEIHSEKDHYELTPGQNLTLNWGISQYLPLTQDQHFLLEFGPAGYDVWQTTDDHGDDARDDQKDQVHAVGGQIGITYVPWMLITNFHVFQEYESEDRFQGRVVGFSVGKKFW
jgi:hypothetical protein